MGKQETTIGDKITAVGIIWLIIAGLLSIVLCVAGGGIATLLIAGATGAFSGFSIIVIGFITNLFQSMEKALWKIESLLENSTHKHQDEV